MENVLEIQKWFVLNKEKVNKYTGKWVAVSSSGIMAVADSLSALSRHLTESQREELLLTRIPTKKEAANLVV